MRTRSVFLPLVAFIVGLLVSPFLSSVPAARADVGVPCVTDQNDATAPQEDAAAPTPPATPDPPPVNDAPQVPPAPPHIIFSELLPDPEGDDTLGEFIEVENAGDADVDLAGWTVTNAAGKTAVLSADLGPEARYAFMYAETKIALSNAGTTLTLRDAEGRTADAVTYAGPAKTGKAYARDADGAWKWTSTATPGEKNRFDAVMPPSLPAPEPEPAPQPSPTVAEEAASPTIGTTTPSMHVALTAMLPDPIGDDGAEWIEIGNDGPADAILSGWKLDDAEGGSDPYPLDTVVVQAGGKVRIARTASKIALNNDGDEARLLGPDGAVLQRVAYANAPEGRVFADVDGEWTWVPPETGGPAVDAVAKDDVDPVPVPVPVTAAGQPEPDTERPAAASVGDIAPGDDTLLEVDGIITLAPGVIGKRTFAMEDPGGQAGTFVRAYGSSPMPALAPGDRVRITGRAAAGGGLATVGRRIARLAAGSLDFQERGVEEVAGDANGVALAVTGTVARRGKASLALSDAHADREITVRIMRGSALDPKIAVGATVTAKGTLRAGSGGEELIVTAKNGVALAPPPERTPAGPDPTPGPPSAAEEQARQEPRRPLVLGYAAGKKGPSFVFGGIVASGIAVVVALAALAKRRRTADLDRLTTDR